MQEEVPADRRGGLSAVKNNQVRFENVIPLVINVVPSEETVGVIKTPILTA